jgi:hypothetical protein
MGGLLVALTAFAVRVGVIWRHRHRGCDAYYFLFCSEEFRKQKKLPIVLPKVYLLERQEQWYPPGFSVLLALVPQHLLEHYYWAVSPAIDCMGAAVLYIMTCLVTGNVLVGIGAGLLFALNASSIIDCTSLNSRAFGTLLFTLTVLCLISFVDMGGIHWFVLAVVFGFVLLLSHKLSAQLLYVMLPAMSGIFRDWVYILGMVAIIGLAVGASRGMMAKVWKGQKDILGFWHKNWKNLGAHQIYSSPMYEHLGVMDHGKIYGGGIKGLYKLGSYLGLNPFVILLVYPLWNYGLLSAFDRQMVMWVLLTYALALLTMFAPQFRAFGEGYRYLRLVSLPICYLAVLPFYKMASWGIGYHYYVLVGCALAGAIVLLWKLFVFMSHSSGTTIPFLDMSLSEVIRYLKEDDGVKAVLCVPDGIGDAIGYYCRKGVLRGTHNVPFEWVDAFFPVYKLPLDYLIRAYDVSHVVVFHSFVSPDVLGLLPADRVLNKGQYSIYEVRHD